MSHEPHEPHEQGSREASVACFDAGRRPAKRQTAKIATNVTSPYVRVVREVRGLIVVRQIAVQSTSTTLREDCGRLARISASFCSTWLEKTNLAGRWLSIG